MNVFPVEVVESFATQINAHPLSARLFLAGMVQGQVVTMFGLAPGDAVPLAATTVACLLLMATLDNDQQARIRADRLYKNWRKANAQH